MRLDSFLTAVAPTRSIAPTPPKRHQGDLPHCPSSRDTFGTTIPPSPSVVAISQGANEVSGTVDKHHNLAPGGEDSPNMLDEKTPLLEKSALSESTIVQDGAHISIPKRIAGAFVGTLRVVVSTVLAPGRWVVACFYDEDGNFSAMLPVYRLGHIFSRKQRRKKPVAVASSAQGEKLSVKVGSSKRSSKNSSEQTLSDPALDAGAPAMVPEPASENGETQKPLPIQRHVRSPSTSSTGSDDSENPQPKRSIRINALNDDALRQRKLRREQQRGKRQEEASDNTSQPALTVDSIKSPINPVSSAKITKYPRAPAPPRPLVPRRQPSYKLETTPSSESQKTLIVDLDETLIHSMAKGGRMSTGHMVEVKLSTPVGSGGAVFGPQVPILYFVHKRPYCDTFLQKVSKWYNLVAFTASVQEYADPVIDHLEQERKYFSARYYRQHCTLRNGAYIKDLSQVEPDLSKVMILDNSPMSYILNEDNAIPIEGWINDPTDNNLMNLVPLLEGLQWVTDVRALLSLRLGESRA